MRNDNPLLDVEFTFDGRKYRRRPTWELIVKVERATNQSCVVLAFSTEARRILVADLAVVVATVINHGLGDDPDDEAISSAKVGEIIMERGITSSLYEGMQEILFRATKGNETHLKEAAAAKTVANPSDDQQAGRQGSETKPKNGSNLHSVRSDGRRKRSGKAPISK